MKPYIEHIRLVHFSLVITSLFSFYLLVAGWTLSNEVARDLVVLKRDVQALKDTTPASVLRRIAMMTERSDGQVWCDELSGALSRLVGTSIQFDLDRFGVTLSNQLGDVQSVKDETPLRIVRAVLEGSAWVYWVPNSNVNLEPREQSYLMAWARAGDSFDNTASASESFSAELEIVEQQPGDTHAAGRIRITGSKQGNVNSDFYLGPETRDTGWVKCSLEIRQEVVRLPNEWFRERYPRLFAEWSYFRDRTMEEALLDAQHKRTEKVRGREIKFGAVTASGEDVAWFAPIVLFSIMLYLFVYIRELLREIGSASRFDDVWIGSVDSSIAQVMLFSSVVLAPPIAVYLLMDRFLDASLIGGGIALAMVVLGLSIFKENRRIRDAIRSNARASASDEPNPPIAG